MNWFTRFLWRWGRRQIAASMERAGYCCCGIRAEMRWGSGRCPDHASRNALCECQ